MISFIKTADKDKIILVIDGQISHAINSQCNEWQEYEQFIADGGIEIEAQPSDCHEFVNGVWVLSAALEAEKINKIRELRNNLLSNIDKYQGVLMYAELTPEQQTELAEYRQLLKDAPALGVLPPQPDWIK